MTAGARVPFRGGGVSARIRLGVGVTELKFREAFERYSAASFGTGGGNDKTTRSRPPAFA
jgi:hypothetical protein